MRKDIKKALVGCVIGCTRVYIKILNSFKKLFSKSHSNNLNDTLLYICQAAETKMEYVSYQIKPKNTAVIPILDGLNQSHSFAIVMQGPICTEDNMTANTIMFYQKSYPYAKIILSTWCDEPKTELKRMAELGAVVVTCDKPLNSGFMNINMQLVTSLAGVKRAKELGCEFAVKTRTDQRICKPFIFDAMISAIKLFPGGKYQRGRMVVLGRPDGGMFVPYHPCDFLYLAYTEDLLKLFSTPLETRPYDEKLQKTICTLSRHELSKQMLTPEIYIFKHYCSDVLKINCEDTIKTYWAIVKNNLICYSMKDVDLMWNKYTRLYDLNYYSSSYYSYAFPGVQDSAERLYTMCFDFFNWFNLYMGNINYEARYEQYTETYAGLYGPETNQKTHGKIPRASNSS